VNPLATPPRSTDEAKVRYETRDVRLRPLLLFVAGLGSLLLLLAAAMAALFGWLADDRIPAGLQEAEIETAQQLQTARQLQELRRREDELLNSYAWVDKDEGLVRIPVSRAIELVVNEAKGNGNDE